MFSLNTDFVSWRGHFTKFLLTPYENREPWKMAVSLFNGTWYISEIETEKARHDRLNRSEMQQEMCYWGYKFEDYLTQSVHGKCIEFILVLGFTFWSHCFLLQLFDILYRA